MKKIVLLPLVCLLVAFNCKKKTKPPEPCPEPIPKQDSIFFLFVNRIGFKKDSINDGNGNITLLNAVDIKTGYFNSKTNKSNIYDVIYGRTSGLNKLKDSILQSTFPCYINSQYNLEVSLYWIKIKGKQNHYGRSLTFQLNTNGNDTVKTSGDKTVKFIWPDDTASGKYTKTYDWTPPN